MLMAGVHIARRLPLPARMLRGLVAIVVMLALLAMSCQSIVEETLNVATVTHEVGPNEDYIAVMAGQINAARVSEGLSQLKWSAELADAAQKHAHDMAASGFVSHTGSDGSDVAGRMERAGYSSRFRGEIIVWASGGPQGAIDWWWNSPLHRNTMLGPLYVDFGVGVAAHRQHAGQHYYVAVFGAK